MWLGWQLPAGGGQLEPGQEVAAGTRNATWQEGHRLVSGRDQPRSQPAGGWSQKAPFRILRRTRKQGQPPAPRPQPGRLTEGPAPRRGGEGRPGVWSVSLTLLLSRFPSLASLTACSCLSLGFWWWKSSSLCEANDLPLCEAYWRLDLDTDSADGLSVPLPASPEPSAGPLQAAAPAHSHAGGPGPAEHA